MNALTLIPLELKTPPPRPVVLRPDANTLNSPVAAVESSYDGKLANRKKGQRCHATHVAQESCPEDCVFRGSGCYAEHHMQGIHTRRLAEHIEDLTKDELGLLHAQAIDRLSGKHDCRLNVVGDNATPFAARVTAEACRRFMGRARKGKRVWGYTHAWRAVPRANWGADETEGGVSILASCETVADAYRAYNAGYAPALVVTEFERETAYFLDADKDLKGVPCPAQTKRADSCVSCRLCMNSAKLRAEGLVILFETHGGDGNVHMARKAVERQNR